jgi:hypothetical protein
MGERRKAHTRYRESNSSSSPYSEAHLLIVLYRPQTEAVVKLKVKLSPCLIKHHAVKVYWESGGIAPRIVDLGTR